MSDAWEPSCSLEALEARAELLTEIRSFFRDRQVLEVQTALIAEHTVTDLHIDSLALTGGSFLQTSPEYQLKRLLAAGAPSLYQLAPVFRAGEQGRLHNPEFTLLEWYRLGFDDEALRVEVAALVDQVLGPAPYQTISYAELLQGTGATPDRSGSETDPDALDLAFAEATAALRGRWFITRYPAAQAALARLCADDPTVAARFELVVDGVELANGYHELTDPDEQRQRFQKDLEMRRERGLPLRSIDEKFLAALQAGLPDCAGVALGVDRLLMLKLGVEHIDQVQPFPWDRA